MKAILTIGGESFLIPKTTDLNKILELFQGARTVRNESIYGPDKARYEEPFYVNRTVAAAREAKVRVELLHDDEVVSHAEWAAIGQQHAQACAEFSAKELAVAG